MFKWAAVGAAATMSALSLSCDQVARTGHLSADARTAVVFTDDFESGTLSAWSDRGEPSRLRIVTNAASAQSGKRYLAVTYPAGQDGGWLTRFVTPGYESLYVSYSVRFPRTWAGGTKLVALYGSRSDDPWSAFGKAGLCPDGADFFAAMLVTEPSGPLRFYTYYPRMAREPDGVTCWGRHGNGAATYRAPLTLSPDVWHRIEFLVRLNTPGRSDAHQAFWIDGVERGSWSGFSFRESPILRLNSVQLTFSVSGGVPVTQELHVDDVVILRDRPAIPSE